MKWQLEKNIETNLFIRESDEFGPEGHILESIIPGMETVGHIEVEVAADAKYHARMQYQLAVYTDISILGLGMNIMALAQQVMIVHEVQARVTCYVLGN